MEKKAELKFTKNDVTEMIDFERNFGDLLYIAHKEIYVYEGEEDQRTQEHSGFEMLVLSSVNGKPYKIKFDDISLDFTKLVSQEIVVLKKPVVRQYIESGAKSRGIAVSISAQGLIVPTGTRTNNTNNRPNPQVNQQEKSDNK